MTRSSGHFNSGSLTTLSCLGHSTGSFLPPVSSFYSVMLPDSFCHFQVTLHSRPDYQHVQQGPLGVSGAVFPGLDKYVPPTNTSALSQGASTPNKQGNKAPITIFSFASQGASSVVFPPNTSHISITYVGLSTHPPPTTLTQH